MGPEAGRRLRGGRHQFFRELRDELIQRSHVDGWLDAKPREGGDITNRQRLSIKGSADDVIPEVTETALYLLECFYEVGPVAVDAMGRRPLMFADLLSWKDAVGPPLTDWELTTLIGMSQFYSLGLQGGEKGESIPLYEMEDDKRRSVADQIKAAFTRRRKGKKAR